MSILSINVNDFPLAECKEDNDCYGEAVCVTDIQQCQCVNGYTRDTSMHISIHCTAPPNTLTILLSILLFVNLVVIIGSFYQLATKPYKKEPKRIAILALVMCVLQAASLIAHYFEVFHGLFTTLFFCASFSVAHFVAGELLISFMAPIMQFDNQRSLSTIKFRIRAYMGSQAVLIFVVWIIAIIFIYVKKDVYMYNLFTFIFLGISSANALVSALVYHKYANSLLNAIKEMETRRLNQLQSPPGPDEALSSGTQNLIVSDALSRITYIKNILVQTCVMVTIICIPLLITHLVLHDVPYRWVFWFSLMTLFPTMGFVTFILAPHSRVGPSQGANSRGESRDASPVEKPLAQTTRTELPTTEQKNF